mmetsp:Transcript_21056/g.32565  ORF Transcript_21056/g.32565 Transcript_21056/m.32565 type:complete len:98 (+) Transcript_21056:111-404(+)
MMSRVLCFVALLVVATQAFVPTVSRGVAAPRPAFAKTAPRITSDLSMAPVDSIVNDVVSSSNVLASNVGDFGGFLFPVFGIGLLAALILYLSPPLAD